VPEMRLPAFVGVVYSASDRRPHTPPARMSELPPTVLDVRNFDLTSRPIFGRIEQVKKMPRRLAGHIGAKEWKSMHNTTNPPACQEKSPENSTDHELSLIWRRAVSTGNAALEEACRIANGAPRLSRASLAVLLSSYHAALEGKTWEQWLKTIGGRRIPSFTSLDRHELWPASFYHNDRHEQAEADPGPSLPEMLTRSDLAKYLHCSESTVRDRVKRGELPPPTVNGRPQRWLLAQVVKFLEDKPPARAPRSKLFPGRRA